MINFLKTKKAVLSAFALASVSLTGCDYESHLEHDTYSIEELGLEYDTVLFNSILKNLTPETYINDIDYCILCCKTYIQILSKDTWVKLTYNGPFQNGITIEAKENYDGNESLSDKFYERLNLLIQKSGMSNVTLINLDNRFDFSKIDFSSVPIKLLMYRDCNLNLDDSKLSGAYENICFYNVSSEMASKVLEHCDTTNSDIYWNEDLKKGDDLKSLLENLVKNDIPMNSLNVSEMYAKENPTIEEVEFHLLSKVNSKSISIVANGFKEPVDLDLKLNNQINEIGMYLYKSYYDNELGELGDIKIESANKMIRLSFLADITKNTHFSFPDLSWISFLDLSCMNTEAFEDLRNVECIYFSFNTESILDKNMEDSIMYCSNENYFTFYDDIYRDFYDTIDALKKVDMKRQDGVEKGKQYRYN